MDYLRKIDWETIFELFEMETIDEYHQCELHLLRSKLASGHEVYMQSLESVFDSNSQLI